MKYLNWRWWRWHLGKSGVAELLNRRRDMCWADLVMWSMYSRWRDLRSEVIESPGGPRCQRDALKEGHCYCGKFARQDTSEKLNLLSPFIVTPDNVGPEELLVFRDQETSWES